jgi:zinc protease
MITSLTLAVMLLAAVDPAQKAGPAPKLRSPDEILADYIKAIGGAEALNKIQSVHLKRKLEVKGMQFTGREERSATAAGQLLVEMEITGVTKARQGTDGKVQWSDDQIFGLRILSGAEEEEARIDSTWNSDLHLKELYQQLRSVPPPEPTGGRPWECIEMTPKVGKPTTSCFDAETHLRTLQKGIRAAPQGETPVRATFSDWRAVKGVKVPWVEELTMGPVTMVARVTELKFDEKFPAKLFALPKAARESKPARPAAEAQKK